MIKALLLDLDDTLIDRDAALRAWLYEALPAHARTAENVRALVVQDRGGRGSRTGFFGRVGALADISAQEARRRFMRELPRHARLKPDADALLHSFPGVTAIVTNGPSTLQRAKVASAGLAHRVEHVLVSEELGVRKPNPAFFHAALARVGCASNEALMVGDDPRTDIGGARAVGIEAVHVRTRWFAEAAGARSVQHLTEITW